MIIKRKLNFIKFIVNKNLANIELCLRNPINEGDESSFLKQVLENKRRYEHSNIIAHLI